MNKPLVLGLAMLSVLAALGPCLAAEIEVPAPARARHISRPQTASPAAQAPAKPATQTASTNWTGGQLGASNGISSVNNNFVEPGAYICPASFPFGVSCSETPFSFSRHPLSYTIGPFIGYRWQLGMSVVGIEADWSWKQGASNFNQSVPFVCFDAACANFRSDMKFGSVKQTWDSSIRIRYGWLVTPRTLIYGTFGVAVGRIEGTFSYSGVTFFPFCDVACITVRGSSATSAASWADTRIGEAVGAGIETEIWAGWKARVEYRYTDFGSYTRSIPVSTICALGNGCSAPSAVATVSLRESFQTVRVGLARDF